MKKNLPVTDKGLRLPDDKELVSATVPKGVITHANQAFLRVSEFDWEDLHGASHNIVRYPDMPPAAFQNMCDLLGQGLPWMGIVKNRRKNGDHFWVDAFVTPAKDGDSVVGYGSVRATAQADSVARAATRYRKPERGSTHRRLPTIGMSARLAIVLSAAATLGIFGGAVAAGPDLGAKTRSATFSSRSRCCRPSYARYSDASGKRPTKWPKSASS